MRQRNDTGYPQHVSAWPTDDRPDQAPFDLAPGGETDYPGLLGGFTSLEPEPVEDESASTDAEQSAAQAAAKPKPRAKTAPTATSAEGGEAA